MQKLGIHSPRVLVVDDELVVREVARGSLEAVGMGVECVSSGEAALEAFSCQRPDLVLLDVSMTGMDGFETCAAIRNVAGGEAVPIIIATGLDDHNSVTKAFEVGATDFITKPLVPPMLQNRVRFTLRAFEVFGELRESKHQLAHAQALAQVGSWELDVETEQFACSSQLAQILGVSGEAAPTSFTTLLDYVHPGDREIVEKAFRQVRDEKRGWSSDHRIVRADAAERAAHTSLQFRHRVPGDLGVVAGSLQDITERKKTEEEIRRLAYFDSLTSLPNRRLFGERLEKAVESARRQGRPLAVLFVDVDRFKRINDTLGHDAGDELLREFSKRLIDNVRMHDGLGRSCESETVRSVARLGGDEFTVFLNRLWRPEEAAIVARRILKAFEAPISLASGDVVVTASIGIAVWPADGEVAEQLLSHADTAMYHAKREGGARFKFFGEAMNRAHTRKLELENALRSDLKRDAIDVHYQPTVDARTGRVVGAEALARWTHEGESVSPMEFIPVAEDSGLIVELGERVLYKACVAIGELGGRVSVNVSSVQLRLGGFADRVAKILSDTGFAGSRLDLEITESVFLEDEARVSSTLRALNAMGLRLILDDFGTGYASMSYLTRLPIAGLKIDRTFTRGIPEDEKNAAIVSATIAMASRLGLQVTVEGVETATEAEYVASEGASILQGFHISRPLTLEAFSEFLAAGSPIEER
jgi:diguanylate cyclase (GGDEF)-like protein/PAS domain S-box-containing protein